MSEQLHAPMHGLWLAASLAVIAGAACAQPRGSRSTEEKAKVQSNESTGPGCIVNADCLSGLCQDGSCFAPTDCTDSNDCGPNMFCHFADPPNPWVSETTGKCSIPCASNEACGLGQICIDGVCYSQLDCNPATNHFDCPPGEVCDAHTRLCSPPPIDCAWETDCPAGWVCNFDDTCIDPGSISLSGCSTDVECSSVGGCAGGVCTCEDGACTAKACVGSDECGLGQSCDASICQLATACPNGHSDCAPFGQHCESGHCLTPTACQQPGNECPSGFTCREQTSGPRCLPNDMNQCSRDAHCPEDMFCELFTGTCQPGCREHADCAGECDPTATQCSCNASHQCVEGTVGVVGSSCASNNDCSGGYACAYNDPSLLVAESFEQFGEFACSTGMLDCTRSCRAICDTAVNAIINTCPDGESCGLTAVAGDSGGSQALATGYQLLIQILAQQMAGTDEPSATAAVCYPKP